MTMLTSIDQLGEEHTFDALPQRIVSLVPSITELLCDLGLEDQVIGCTKFCVHPAGLRKRITVIGGTKQVHIERVLQLAPDLVIANKEENTKADIEALRQHCPVWVSEISNLATANVMIRALAGIFGRTAIAAQIIDKNQATLDRLAKANQGTALYLIWQNPYMSVGGDTYIHDIMERLGYENCCGQQTRYPSLTSEALKALAPKHLLLSSEPFPFSEQHIQAFKTLLPDTNIQLVDGELFSWYGGRLGKL